MIELQDALNRRTFLKGSAHGMGMAALGSLLGQDLASGMQALEKPHHRAKAKRIIYMFQSGAPSQMDLFDPKPGLEKRFGEELPASIRMGQRITGMTSGQKTLPVAPSIFKFAQHGQSGTWLSELLPHTAKIADEICMIRSMYTEAINH
ncbi:MAG: DUF1501 domain-containing protein, partial [Verrucomicrobiota bacterium]